MEINPDKILSFNGVPGHSGASGNNAFRCPPMVKMHLVMRPLRMVTSETFLGRRITKNEECEGYFIYCHIWMKTKKGNTNICVHRPFLQPERYTKQNLGVL